MSNGARQQRGRSTLVTLIYLALMGFGIYLAVQYVPQFIESRSVQSILDSMQDAQRLDPVESEGAAREKVVRLLQINEMNDMTNDFKVTRIRDGVEIRFSYDRDLNLLYKTKPIHYEMSVQLK